MRNWSKIGVGGMLFLLPFLCNPFAPVEFQLELPKLMGVFLLGSFLFAAYLGQTIHFSLGFAYAVFSVLVVVTGFGRLQIYPFAAWTASLFTALFFLRQDEETKRFLLACIVYGAVFSAFYGFMQMMGVDPVFDYAEGVDRTHPIAFLGQTTKFGAFLAMSYGLALGLRMWPAAVTLFLAGIATASSFTALSLVVATIIFLRYAIGRNMVRGLVFSGLGLGIALYAMFPSSSIFVSHGRFEVWQTAIDAWWNGPRLFGFGPGSFGVIYHKYFQPEHLRGIGQFLQSHNDYVQLLFEGGLLGACAAIFVLFYLAKHYCACWWKRGVYPENTVIALQCMMGAILVNAIGNFPFQLAPHFLIATIGSVVLLRELKGVQ